jgi:hypothetical protein
MITSYAVEIDDFASDGLEALTCQFLTGDVSTALKQNSARMKGRERNCTISQIYRRCLRDLKFELVVDQSALEHASKIAIKATGVV